jgi:hypothetical protein
MGGLRSGVAIANNSSNAENITLELYGLDGASTGLTGTLSLPARGQRSMFLNEIPGFESLANGFQGILRIAGASNAPISVIALRGRTNERNEFIVSTMNATLEGETPAGPLMFPHVVDGDGYSTQFLLVGPSSSLSMFSQNGTAMSLSMQ